MLDNYRASLDWWLDPLTRLFRKVHPDVFTWLSLVFAVAGGILFWKSSDTATGLWILLAAWVCVGLNSILDLLDGKVAKISGKASPRGDFLDHAVDRASDAAFILGISFSPWATVGVGLAAMTATLLVSYMGTQAQAVGLKRHYGGLLGRADRMVLLLAMPLAQWIVSFFQLPHPWTAWTESLLALLLWYFAIVGGLTLVQRFVAILRSFGPAGKLR